MTQEEAVAFARELATELGTFSKKDGERLANFWNRAVGSTMFIVRRLPGSDNYEVIEKGTE